MDENDIIRQISELSPTQFENLVFDILRVLGFKNLVWRTPGSDGGRDIEGQLHTTDPTGYSQTLKWYIECKRYSNSISWATVWEKIAHADVLGADIIFLVTNSSPSPQCESRIAEWNEKKRRPGIRVWRGYNFPNILRVNSDLAASYGLIGASNTTNAIGGAFALQLAKLAQSAHGAIEFGRRPDKSIEAASSLSELFEQRLRDIQNYGRAVRADVFSPGSLPSWLHVDGMVEGTEDVSFRALAAFLRHLKQCTGVTAKAEGQFWVFEFEGCKASASPNPQNHLEPLAHWFWCDEITLRGDGALVVGIRE